MIFQIFSSLFILITFYLQNQVLSSPVLLWSNVNLHQSDVPLSTLSSHNLISDYICKLTNEQIKLQLFAVNDLTIEDFQHGSQRNHPLLLDAKKHKTNFRYYPNVANDVYNTFSLIPRSNNMKCSHINFEIISSNVYETLNEALNNITEITNDNFQTDTNNAVIIALINGPNNAQKLSRRRRQTNDAQTKVLISNDTTCMFYAQQLRWNDVDGTESTARNYSLNFTASSCKTNMTTVNGNYSTAILNLNWVNDNNLSDIVTMSLITTIIGRYWYLQNVTLNNNVYRYFAFGMYDLMTTPPTYSYVCTTATFIRYNNSTTNQGQYNFTDQFYLLGLQFQPFNVSGLSFGLPNYCTSFFTSGIWMGITSSLLCLAILLFGIHRMMSIKSNDRFDDPKGKPLVIKAQE